MAHRSIVLDGVGGSVLNDEGGPKEMDKSRVARRGRSATPGVVSLWAENRRLYMDNLRLWDCLTLVRSDPTVTCQNAIKLVFGLGDDEYLRTFPDTKQLMQLMFPGGVVYHTCSEEARTENARLKDENARLHAAVWVLRDNPSLQADSTVAAIFRLDEAQFQSKFQSGVMNQDMDTAGTPNSFQIQNNNKIKKKSYRTSLDLGNEFAMAIQLSNTPVKAGSSPYLKPCSSADKRQRCRSVTSPSQPGRKHSGNVAQHQDFTSNWKPTTPLSCELAAGHIVTSTGSQVGTDFSHTLWRSAEEPQFSDGGKLKAEPENYIHCQNCCCPQDQWQSQETVPRCMKTRELRRSNTVSGVNNILEERFCRSTRAVPIKCVSFAEPLCCYGTCSTTGDEFVCFRDKVKAILDANCDHCCLTQSKQKHAPQCPKAAPGKTNGLTKNANSNMGSYSTEKSSRVYTTKATREPSKRYQKDVATSPVLHIQTCFLQSDEPTNAILHKHQSQSNNKCCITSASDSYMLNKSSNNDGCLATSPSALPKSDASSTSSKCHDSRPLAPKRRNLRQARMKNILSCQKILSREQSKVRTKIEKKLNTCSTNNAVLRFKSLGGDIGQSQEGSDEALSTAEDELEQANKPDFQASDKVASSISSESSVSTPEITYSTEPAPTRRLKNMQYSIESYPTVKHFLDRHRRIMNRLSSSAATKEVYTREITPSVAELEAMAETSDEKSRMESDLDLEKALFTNSSEPMADKYKARWKKTDRMHDETTVTYLNAGIWQNYSRPGIPKECKPCICNRAEGLKELKKLGKFKYTTPLATMLKRSGCYQWKAYDGSISSSGTITLNVRPSLLPGMKVQMRSSGPFITFVPRDKEDKCVSAVKP